MSAWANSRCAALLLALSGAVLVMGAAQSAATSTRVNESKYGFSFTLPPKWEQIPLNGRDISGILDQALKADPAMKGSMTKEVQAAAKNGIKFFAIGPVLDQFASNLNIIVTSSAGYPNNSSYYGIADSQIKINLTEAGFKDLKTSLVHLPFGKEIEATYELPSSLSGVPADGLQLYVKHKSHFEVITFTSHSSSVNQAAAEILEQSWKWG